MCLNIIKWWRAGDSPQIGNTTFSAFKMITLNSKFDLQRHYQAENCFILVL